MSPRVSVVMPVRDAERFLKDAVESVLAQTFGDLELLAVDDGSRDASAAILARYAAADARVRVLSSPARGVAGALNAGIAAARASYVARMDADDVSEPDRLARQLAVLDADPGIVLVGAAATLVDDRGRVVGSVVPPAEHEAIAQRLLTHNVVVHGTVVVRRAAWSAVGGYDLSAHLVEDYDLWCRLLAHGRLANVAAPLYRLRVHGGSVSARAVSDQLEAAYGVRRRHFGTPPPSWAERRTARADRHLAYARMLATPGDAPVWRQLIAAWQAKPWSPTVLRHGVSGLRGRLEGSGASSR